MDNYVLNQRQKSILCEVGLPEQYEELDILKQKAIRQIEEALVYVEEKYKLPFLYAGYVHKDYLDNEHLLCYPKNGFQKRDVFRVDIFREENKVRYEDDFMNIAARDVYAEYLLQGLIKCSDADGIKIFSDVSNTSLSTLPVQSEQIAGHVVASNTIFLEKSEMTKAEFEQLMLAYQEWAKSEELYGQYQMCLVKEGVLQEITAFNFNKFFFKEYLLQRETLSVRRG